MSIRTERVASVVREALAKPLGELASECNAGFITVTHVRVSPDLRFAKVYLSIFGGKSAPADVLEQVKNRAGYIRRHLGSAVRLRYTPELSFFLDDTLDSMEHIQRLIDETRKNSPAADESHPDEDTNDREGDHSRH